MDEKTISNWNNLSNKWTKISLKEFINSCAVEHIDACIQKITFEKHKKDILYLIKSLGKTIESVHSDNMIMIRFSNNK